MKLLTRRAVLVLVAAGLVLAGITVGPRLVRLGEAALLLTAIQAQGGPSLLGALTETPARDSVRLGEVGGRLIFADLYGEDVGSPGLVVVPGLTPNGRDDPHVVAFATALARSGFTVLVPELPRVRSLQVGPDDAPVIALAAAWLSARRAGPVGLIAISYAVGPTLLALASDPEAERAVGLAVLVGGYHRIRDLVAYVTTGWTRDPQTGGWRQGDPAPRAKWYFALANAEALPDAHDRAFISWLARARLEGRPVENPPLSPHAEAVMALLDNRDPERVEDLIEALPEPVLRRLTAMDPSRLDLSSLAPRFVVVHGRDDPVIPSTHAAPLAAALPSSRTRLLVLDGLWHVNLDDGLAVGDVLLLLELGTELLAGRDRLAASAGDGLPVIDGRQAKP